jgi:cobalt-precorrin-7 (C5)-methyltransferase
LEHQLTVVGIGPGSREYILPAALRLIEAAEFLVGGRRALETYAKPHQQSYKVDADIAGLVQIIKRELAVRDVVVMVSGDPGYFSLLDTFRRELPQENLQVIPGISSFQFAFARIGMSWKAARLVSAHGRQPEPTELEYGTGRVLSLLTDGRNHPARIARWLQRQGWPLKTKVWLCKNLSYEDETILATTLEESLQVSGFDSCVMVVME